MFFSKIDINEVKKMIIRCFDLDEGFTGVTLTPDRIHKVFMDADIALKWEPIPNWKMYESGEFELSDDELIWSMLKRHNLESGLLYIINDLASPNYFDKSAFMISYDHVEEFVKFEYFELFKRCFFGKGDIIFFKPDDKFISILHHSGYMTTYRKLCYV
ncbi:MAG TPA: hypothetical protein VF941_01010 [Clostridia bacterium]